MLHFLEPEFAKIHYTVLSPSQPIQSAEYLRGRRSQLDEIRQAFYSPGRHLFIHGYRGVGKTSLAHTAAFQYQSSDNKPVSLSCAESTFAQLVHGMVARVVSSDPTRIKQASERTFGVSAFGFSAAAKEAVEHGRSIPVPETINDALSLARFFQMLIPQAPLSSSMNLIS